MGIEFFYWMTGALGIALSAQGFRGLSLRKNIRTAWELTDPLGRYDFLFSEGQFDLIVRHIEQDFLLSLGSLILFSSLFLGSVANKNSRGWWFAVISGLTGIVLSLVIRRIVHCAATRAAARELERRARSIQDPGRKDRLRDQIQGWFKKKVGRDPEL